MNLAWFTVLVGVLMLWVALNLGTVFRAIWWVEVKLGRLELEEEHITWTEWDAARSWDQARQNIGSDDPWLRKQFELAGMGQVQQVLVRPVGLNLRTYDGEEWK